VLAGGGVVGGMYEVGALAALAEALPGFRANAFDLYVGSSAGAVVAALMANGVPPGELYRILDEGANDPLNFTRESVFLKGSFTGAAWNFAQLVWAVGKNVVRGWHLDWPDLLARSRGAMPAGFFSLQRLEHYLRTAFGARGLANDFRACPRPLVIPAMDLDRGERVVFGLGDLADVPISDAVAASSAIPGFFEPYHLRGRDYVDGDVGHTGHADLAVDLGATFLVVINPLVPHRSSDGGPPAIRRQGLYGILEQAGRITSQNILELGLRELRLRRPEVEFHLIQPAGGDADLAGPSMGFEASRRALRRGYAFTRERLEALGRVFADRFRA